MRKKALTMVLILSMVFSAAVGVYAAPQGERVPIRATFEEAAAQVNWSGTDRSIHITLEGNSIVFFTGSTNAFVNGQPITLQDSIIIIQGRAFITTSDLFTIIQTIEAQAAPSHVHGAEVPQGGVITGALHRIEYGGNVVYLFGSMHAGRYGWFPLAYSVESAMRRADIFAFEADLSDPAMLEAMAAATFLPDGVTLDDLLTPEEVEAYISALLSFGIPEESLVDIQRENPVFLSLLITQLFLLEAADNLEMDTTQTVDFYVMSFAEAQNLPIIFLEPVEQQIRLLYLPPNDVIAHVARNFPTLDELLRELTEAAELGYDLNGMAAMYEINDLAALTNLTALTLASEDILIKYHRDMLYNFRSTYYANEILRLLRETQEPTTFFVTVGVSHIIRSWAGEAFTDIVAQLALRGVEAVPLF
ncbi:MAG: TraB/GumN family protein [Defluviitaleaceae bacterium]|nr:TraB/GumN family protein [Defluviitaleaceae bacterium]MCL2240648.1 TraB/GumN family protein [Defluviitaleaceae bacterium]